MIRLRHPGWGRGPSGRPPSLAAALLLACLVGAAQASTAQADIVNGAIAGARHGDAPVTSNLSSQSVPVAPAEPGMEVRLEGALNDDDGSGGPSAGDTITWSAIIENRGNTTLTAIAPSSPLAAFACGEDGEAVVAALAPGATIACTARTVLSQGDLDDNGGGDGDIDASVTVASAQIEGRTARAAVAISATPAMRLDKRIESWRRLFPGTYEINYALVLENTGTTTLNRIRLADDLGQAFSPHAILAGTEATIRGWTGGSANPGYDGVADAGLLAGDAALAPGEQGEASIRVRVGTGPGSVELANGALATAAQLPGPAVAAAPAILGIEDSDGDGALDSEESMSADRDGDGTPDALDHDPTGYFYCEADGRILPGGRISVEMLPRGGSRTPAASGSGVSVIRDGSDGRYQFHVTAAGRYRLSFDLPPAGVASTARRASPVLDVTDFLPAGPGIIGSGEAGTSGRLADFTAAGNPYHLEFDIEAGDPAFFNNNIPVKFCGTPELALEGAIIQGPLLRADGSSQLSYRLTARASGSERVDEVRIADNLAAAFGAGNYRVVSNRIAAAPKGFGAATNPFFDGEHDLSLLTSGGDLEAGEEVGIELAIVVRVAAGSHANVATATGLSPLDARAVAPAAAVIPVIFAGVPDTGHLAAELASEAAAIRPGDAVAYTLTLRNDTASASEALDLVSVQPGGFAYLPGSARLDGSPREPVAAGSELIWKEVAIPANREVSLRFELAAGATASGAQFTSQGFARDPVSGAIVSNVAELALKRQEQAIFDCSEIVGRVFEDDNRDGYRQEGEAGIAGVTVTTAGGDVLTSDAAGFFRVTCPMIAREAIGGEYVVTLDTATLPAGYRLTSENPRSLTLERGRTASLGFGAASLRVVAHILDEGSFETGTTSLKPVALRALAKVLNLLEEEISILRITYLGSATDPLARRRTEAAGVLIDRAWNAGTRPYPLTIEIRFSE